MFHQTFAQRRQRHGNLDRGAGLKSAAERQLLVDHGQDAAGIRVGHHDGAVERAERFNRSLADFGIVALGSCRRMSNPYK